MRHAEQTSLIVLDSLMTPGELGPYEQKLAARKLVTLLSIGTLENQQGGMGKATKVFNCYGEPLCLKSIGRIPEIGKTKSEVRSAFLARAIAFKEEYTCQKSLIGIPGVPRIFGYGTYANGPVMLMDWIHGVPLRKAFQTHLDAFTCEIVGAQLASVLEAARIRDRRFVHRDLSGRNVLVRTSRRTLAEQRESRDYDLCLIDFGSALNSDVREFSEFDKGLQIWRNATPEYAPPEMLTHSELGRIESRSSEKVDVYEMCSILWELYWGSTPYELTKSGIRNAYSFKLERPPRRPYDFPSQDDDFMKLLETGLDSNPDRRPHLHELRKTLISLCAQRSEATAYQLNAKWDVYTACARKTAPTGKTIIRG